MASYPSLSGFSNFSLRAKKLFDSYGERYCIMSLPLPSVFGVDLFFDYPILGQLFEAQTWILEKLQEVSNLVMIDNWYLATSLLFAPVLEELIYRGPLFLSKGLFPNYLWWLIGIGLTVVFALSHGRNGLALLPLFVLGICSLWLISSTQRFWPSIALHFLHNFFFSSVLVYQSLWFSD